MRLSPRSSAVCTLLVLAALLPACGDKSPTTPTAGTPTPTPTPQPTATPPPTTGAPSLPQSCRSLPPTTGSPSGCSRGTANFRGRVQAAVDATYGATYRDPSTNQSFEIVQGDGRINVAGAYLKAVADALDRQGICAVFDGEEIWVSDGGGYNEHYDIITADGFSWVNYAVTCNPALPMPRLPPPAPVRDPECRSLPASALTFCSRPSSVYDGDVWDAQDQLIAEDRARPTPQIFNFNVKLGGLDYGYLIADQDRYIAGLLTKIRAKGLCAMFDGTEFLVKRNNVFSEHMDMTRADGFAIRNHISTCRDAAF
jgi:hypothetical protein